MRGLRSNILINLAGQGWAALVQVAVIPLYVRLLGIEAYGLIGFYVTVQSMLTVLDLGVSPTVNRELARRSALPGKGGEARDFVRTLEVGYWAAGLVIGATIVAGAPFVASRWIQPVGLTQETVRRAVAIMGVVSALQWPLSFYQGGLRGLQRLGVLNGIRIAMTTVGAAGAVLVLARVSPTITAYFGWQAVVSAAAVGLTTVALWRRLPPSDHAPRFAPGLLRGAWRFAAGMSAITASALVLTQLDKLVLSRLLTLQAFGYYALASVVSNGLYIFISPVFDALFPRLSALAAVGDEATLRALYHRGSQAMAVLVLPVAAVLALFAGPLLLLWTGSPDASRRSAPIVSLLVIGTALNGLMHLPYALQLAHGWTSLGLRINLCLIAGVAPAVVLTALHWGPTGAAAVWAASNLAYLAAGLPLTHRRLLPGSATRWLVEDVGRPLAAALAVAGVGRWLLGTSAPSWRALPALIAVAAVALVAAALAAPRVRPWLLDWIRRPAGGRAGLSERGGP